MGYGIGGYGLGGVTHFIDELLQGFEGVEGEEPFAPEECFVLLASALDFGKLAVEIGEDARGFFVQGGVEGVKLAEGCGAGGAAVVAVMGK